MKKFLIAHSYNMVRMFLNQFAIAIFGFGLALATIKAGSVDLRNATSIFAIAFYLFLIYTMTWDLGYKERAGVEAGRKEAKPMTGALIALCANVPNFIFAIFITLATFIHVEAIGNVGAICKFLAMFLEGMYLGVLQLPVGGAALHSYWFVFFLLPLPTILTAGVAYVMGLKDIRVTRLSDPLIPESDRDPRSKKKTWSSHKEDQNKDQ